MSIVRRYWRFALFLVTFAVSGSLLALRFDPVPSILGGFDIGVAAFIAAMIWSLSDDEADDMRQRSAANEPDQHILLFIAALTIMVVITAVGFELVSGSGRSIALSVATLFLAWVFANGLYALHYAHSWYLDDGSGKDRGGLDFPGDDAPVYWDFVYFAFVLGMTFQVSDVSITSRGFRRTALFHSLLAFWFNVGVLALTVSVVGSVLR